MRKNKCSENKTRVDLRALKIGQKLYSASFMAVGKVVEKSRSTFTLRIPGWTGGYTNNVFSFDACRPGDFLAEECSPFPSILTSAENQRRIAANEK